MSIEDICPHCNADLHAEKIPEDQREAFGGKEYFSKLIGLEDETYDGISYWCCPECWTVWDRFSGKIDTATKEKSWFQEFKNQHK